jgi:hypothetical protein
MPGELLQIESTREGQLNSPHKSQFALATIGKHLDLQPAKVAGSGIPLQNVKTAGRFHIPPAQPYWAARACAAVHL